MSRSKYLARRGAVGGTARWVAQGFHGAILNGIIDVDSWETDEGVEQEIDKIVHFCLMARFQDNPMNPDLASTYSNWKSRSGKGLLSFVEAILAVEASFDRNTLENINMFREVIYEELISQNVGEVAILGYVR
jgi:hypothetical protein